MVQRGFFKKSYLKEDVNKKTSQPPALFFLFKSITFPHSLKHSLYPSMHIWIFHILSVSVCLFWITWAQVCQKLDFVFHRTWRFMIKQVQIRQLMLLQIQSGVIVPGSHAGSRSCLWAIGTSKPYRVAKPKSKCWPLLCLGLGECGWGTGCGVVACAAAHPVSSRAGILGWSVCMAGVLCVLANQGALCCWVWV